MSKIKRRRRRGRLLLALFLVLLGFLLYDSNTRIVTSEYPLTYESLPAAFDGYRIVQLSDLHIASFGDGNTLLLDAVTKACPDIIVITGDLVTYSDKQEEVHAVLEPLVRSLGDIAPVYFVTGNHEWDYDGFRELLALLEAGGVTVLRNDYVPLTVGTDTIILAGVDDPNGPKDMKKPETLLAEIRAAEGDPFIVLLAHRNTYLKRFATLDVELVLCGHAHGGLIRLPFAGGVIGPSRDLFPDYTEGVYELDGTRMLVSRGIGNGTGILRFLNNPQMPVVILRSAGT